LVAIAIETLKWEVEVLESEKTKLSAEVFELARLHLEVNNLHGDREKVEGELARLRRQVEDARTSEMLAVEHASKANETCNNLHSALDAEKQSSTALREQVSLVNKQMEALEGLALVMAETYKAAVEKFGGNTSVLPEETSAYNVLAWLKSHVEKVPSVVGGAVDFAALASATLFAKVQNEVVADVAALGETSGALQKSLSAFMGSFWAPFG
jgi:DNA repair exonuclease SbcCD ATPase subunit